MTNRHMTCLLVPFLFSCVTANAARLDNMVNANVEESIQQEFVAENSQFHNPDEELGHIKVIEKPTCATPDFTKKAFETIRSYINQIPASSTIEKRNKALILANINSFSPVSAEEFKPSTDFNTANALITIKINKKINSRDIILCRQNGHVIPPLYLIAYPYADNFKVHVINLDKTSDNYEDVTFIYP